MSARSSRDTINSVSTAIMRLGVLPTIALAALYLVYLMSINLAGSVRDLKGTMDLHIATTQEIKATLEKQVGHEHAIISILSQSCVMAARTNSDRAACLEAARHEQ